MAVSQYEMVIRPSYLRALAGDSLACVVDHALVVFIGPMREIHAHYMQFLGWPRTRSLHGIATHRHLRQPSSARSTSQHYWFWDLDPSLVTAVFRLMTCFTDGRDDATLG
jgi:hypothetical protein